jgi:uncharacterized protein
MSKVFLDTVGLIALWDVSDQWHMVATQAYRRIKNADAQLFASRPILLECGNAAARRPYREKVVQLWAAFAEDGTLVEPTESDWRLAWDAYSRGEAGSAGIVDHVSFAVMRRLGIHQAFTNDEHFCAAGFEALF